MTRMKIQHVEMNNTGMSIGKVRQLDEELLKDRLQSMPQMLNYHNLSLN